MGIEFIPSDIQEMLRDGLRRWGAARDVREAEEFASSWSFFAEQGWLAAGFAEEAGGLGGTAFDTAVIAEELGRVLVRAPFVEVMSAAELLKNLAPDRLEAVIGGEAIPTLAHDEPAARGDPEWVSCTARKDAGRWLLDGRKSALVGAEHATHLLITAQYPGGGIALFELERDSAPIKAFTTIDDRSGGEVLLEETEAQLIADPEQLQEALTATLDFRLVLESAEMLGAMQNALEMTRDYLQTRKQYGQLIGDFQALRHRLADMFIETEQARSMVLRGLGALSDASSQERAGLAAATKAKVAQAALFTCGQAIQLHGGIGVTDEYPVGHFFKRALAFDQRHGGSARQVERFAELSA